MPLMLILRGEKGVLHDYVLGQALPLIRLTFFSEREEGFFLH